MLTKNGLEKPRIWQQMYTYSIVAENNKLMNKLISNKVNEKDAVYFAC